MNVLFLVLGAAFWIVVSICVGLLFGCLATMNKTGDLEPQGRPTKARLRVLPMHRLDRDRAA
jgi:hypothetical protein